jgi:hypothetical protein
MVSLIGWHKICELHATYLHEGITVKKWGTKISEPITGTISLQGGSIEQKVNNNDKPLAFVWIGQECQCRGMFE